MYPGTAVTVSCGRFNQVVFAVEHATMYTKEHLLNHVH